MTGAWLLKVVSHGDIQKRRNGKMGIGKPYYRIWRPLKGYDKGALTFLDHPEITTAYLEDESFVSKAEMEFWRRQLI